MNIKNIAMIPMRGGSKSIVDKNIKMMAGKPLCAWALEAAVGSTVFSEVIVSTESAKIASLVNNLNLDIRVINRPQELALDSTPTEAVMMHIAQRVEYDVMTLIQVTMPLVTSDDYNHAFEKFLRNGFDSLLSCARVKNFYWNSKGQPINYDPANRPRRQDFEGVFMENGAFYMTKSSILDKYECRLGGKIGLYEMPSYTAVDIDEQDDWILAERLIYKYISTV